MLSSKNPRKILQTREHQLGHFGHLKAIQVSTKAAVSGHYHCARAGKVGGGHLDDHSGEVSRSTAIGRTQIGSAKRRQRRPPWVTRNWLIFRPFQTTFRPPHSSFPPFLDPLNSFPWSLFADSSPLGNYDENKVGRRLNRVFQPR